MKEKICVICSKPLTGIKRLYCSNSCKFKTERNKNNNYSKQQERGASRKKLLVEMYGGKCKKCGYNKNYAALVFHHIKPKSFPLDLRNCSNTNWKSLVKEAKKCELLCQNCHTEHHQPQFSNT